ncbi:ras GTPase-activating protein raskol isoform X4 [Phlebotomus papatasi]|uniref:ras GTPase-activating protein raskol isoform X4 n=1 Tax=Phlebotomus papatasi TaxID=29031 RepID=UPI002483E71B|nr:ras GTPase-activating protein raskol isoform X4 [Phlebotomus papatasi]
MGRRLTNRICEINYPSRIEGWLDVCEVEGQSTIAKNLPWGPLYCVLQQDEQTFTAYCSEELSIFPVTPNCEKKLTDSIFAELPRVRLDHKKRSSCRNQWQGPPTVEEEPEDGVGDINFCAQMIELNTTLDGNLDTSYEKACRRGSAPATPILNQKQPEAPTSRFTNFFSKRSFRANPLKRTKSVTKLERAKRGPGGLRGSRSHESLLSSHAVMSTIDLSCTGAVGVAPVHQSVLGRRHCFQVRGGPRGERYYSCGSRQERDLWIYSLRKSIAPNADHTRRTDNSLKMWVYEAKGLPPKKKYFCEINLDKTLYGRTSVKLKGDLLFWGEYFDFPDIPDINLITVNVFREGERKKKRDKHTYVGCVKIPIHEITARMFCEDWYPIISDKVDSFGRNSVKDGFPTLRIKCRFQSIDILPLEIYGDFLTYLKEHYKKVCEILEPVIGVKAKEDIGQALVLLMHSQGMAGAFLTDVVALDLLRVGDQRLTFRGNSLATKSMEAFLKLTGEQYLQDTLSAPIAEIISSDRDCEVDPSKATGSLSRQQQALRNAVRVAWTSIADSHKHFPPQLRECFATFRERLEMLNREDMADNLISASIFLRFLCPAILSPSLFNITNELPSARATRNLTLVAKTLQTLANFTRFQAKEGFMEFLNDFLEQEATRMKEFLHLISTRTDQPAQETILDWTGYIDQGKQLSILYTLLSESIAKLSSARQQELHHLMLIMEKITKAKEVTVFAQQPGGNQENLGNVQNVQCKTNDRGIIRGVLTPNSLEKNIFRYNDPTCSPFLNSPHQSNGLQHSQSTSSISSAPVLHQSVVIPASIQHHIANSTDRLHQQQQQQANSPARSHKAPAAPTAFYYAPKVIGGQQKDTKDFISSSFRANTLPRNNIIINTNGNHQNAPKSEDSNSNFIQIGVDTSNAFVRKSPTPLLKTTPNKNRSSTTIIGQNRSIVNLGMPTESVVANSSNFNMPMNLEDLDDLLNYADEQATKPTAGSTTKETLAAKGSNASIGQISNVCSSGYQSIATQSQSSSPVENHHVADAKGVKRAPPVKYQFGGTKDTVNAVTTSGQALAFKNPLYHIQNHSHHSQSSQKSSSLTPSSSEERLDYANVNGNNAAAVIGEIRGESELSMVAADILPAPTRLSAHRLPRTNPMIQYKRDEPLTNLGAGGSRCYQRRLSVESARTLSDSSTDTEGYTLEGKRRRSGRSVEQCEREIQRLQASVDSLRHKLEESDLRDSNDDLLSMSHHSDSKMRSIISRLIAMEEELRREQLKMSLALSHKQRVIEAQGQQIAALDAANNRLLSALSSLRQRYETQQANGTMDEAMGRSDGGHVDPDSTGSGQNGQASTTC